MTEKAAVTEAADVTKTGGVPLGKGTKVKGAAKDFGPLPLLPDALLPDNLLPGAAGGGRP